MLTYIALVNAVVEMSVAAADCCQATSKWDELPKEMKSFISSGICFVEIVLVVFLCLFSLLIGLTFSWFIFLFPFVWFFHLCDMFLLDEISSASSDLAMFSLYHELWMNKSTIKDM
jgi:hypothetical protein